MRGHDVTLLEASDRHGGQVALAARSERRRDLIGIVDWRLQQVRKNGADVRFNVLADEDTVMELEPDVVIIATGGMPNTEVCEGAEHVLDVWDVMTSPGERRPTRARLTTTTAPTPPSTQSNDWRAAVPRSSTHHRNAPSQSTSER